MKISKLLGLLAACCLVLASPSFTKTTPEKQEEGKQDGKTTTLNGTTWSTSDLLGIGTLTLSFTEKDATLKRTSEGKSTNSTYPYTFSNGTMKTKGKLLNDIEQDLVGTISGTSMNVEFSKSGNYIFVKK